MKIFFTWTELRKVKKIVCVKEPGFLKTPVFYDQLARKGPITRHELIEAAIFLLCVSAGLYRIIPSSVHLQVPPSHPPPPPQPSSPLPLQPRFTAYAKQMQETVVALYLTLFLLKEA
jgi:hypothetical protein